MHGGLLLFLGVYRLVAGQELRGHGKPGISSGIRQFYEFVYDQALVGFLMPLVCLILVIDPL